MLQNLPCTVAVRFCDHAALVPWVCFHAWLLVLFQASASGTKFGERENRKTCLPHEKGTGKKGTAPKSAQQSFDRRKTNGTYIGEQGTTSGAMAPNSAVFWAVSIWVPIFVCGKLCRLFGKLSRSRVVVRISWKKRPRTTTRRQRKLELEVSQTCRRPTRKCIGPRRTHHL